MAQPQLYTKPGAKPGETKVVDGSETGPKPVVSQRRPTQSRLAPLPWAKFKPEPLTKPLGLIGVELGFWARAVDLCRRRRCGSSNRYQRGRR